MSCGRVTFDAKAMPGKLQAAAGCLDGEEDAHAPPDPSSR